MPFRFEGTTVIGPSGVTGGGVGSTGGGVGSTGGGVGSTGGGVGSTGGGVGSTGGGVGSVGSITSASLINLNSSSSASARGSPVRLSKALVVSSWSTI
ncbi:hypothetical protein F4212_01520 [Candidatus Poribacteria bacterium]|nr:hypothetical protein [Candidatus Poribacteria bacterium]